MTEFKSFLLIASCLIARKEKYKYYTNDGYNHKSESPIAKRCLSTLASVLDF